MSVYCIGVIEPFPCERITEIASADTAHLGLTDYAAPAGPCAALAIVWSDDYETGDPLADEYTGISHCDTANGVGVGGSWGVAPSGTANQQYNCGYLYTLPALHGPCGAVQATFNHDASADNGSGASMFEVRESGGGDPFEEETAISLYHGVGAGAERDHLVLYDSALTEVANVASAITPGSWQVVKMAWSLSSITGGAANNDGWVKVWVDGDLLIDESGLHLHTDLAGDDSDQWDRIWVGPMGDQDDLFLWAE